MKNQLKFNSRDYKLVFELYYLNKAETRKEARLPLNDFRRPAPSKKQSVTAGIVERAFLQSASLKNALVRIAALWYQIIYRVRFSKNE